MGTSTPIEHPSVEDRNAHGKGLRATAEPSGHSGWHPATDRPPIATSAYLSKSDGFDRSITDFSERYADQNEQDYEAFVKAIRAGILEATEESENAAGKRRDLDRE